MFFICAKIHLIFDIYNPNTTYAKLQIQKKSSTRRFATLFFAQPKILCKFAPLN